jgi:4-amino-4-deoxy-L-arabinose transferase-like glycosyltransferase
MIVARTVNLVLYVIAAIFMYLLAKMWFKSEIVGLTSSLLFSLTPASIFFIGHALHPDVWALTTILGSLTLAVYYGEKPKKWLIWLAGLLLGLSVATRPFILVSLPAYWLILKKSKAKWGSYVIILGLGLGIYAAWRVWAYTLGVDPAWENWVLLGQEKLKDMDVVWRQLLKRNVVGEVMGKTISGLMVLGLGLGLWKKEGRVWPWIGWIFMLPIYWLIAPNGNITHQYYADIFIPPVVIIAGYFLAYLWQQKMVIGRVAALGLVILAGYNGYRTSGYYFGDIEKPENLIRAREIQSLIPEGKKVIYLYRGDSVPLSLSHRQGWILGSWPIDISPHWWSIQEVRRKGFDYIVDPKGGGGLDGEGQDYLRGNFVKFTETENLVIWEYR